MNYQLLFFIGIGVASALLAYYLFGRKGRAGKGIKMNIPVSMANPLSKGQKESEVSTAHEIEKPTAPLKNSNLDAPISGVCGECGEKTTMPFKCSRCGRLFCSKHRLPEAHECGLE